LPATPGHRLPPAAWWRSLVAIPGGDLLVVVVVVVLLLLPAPGGDPWWRSLHQPRLLLSTYLGVKIVATFLYEYF
jgi:hypothetical protein